MQASSSTIETESDTRAKSPVGIWKRVGAVLAGIVTGIVLSLGTDVLMHATGIFPGWGEVMSGGLFMLATTYRTIYNVVASYVTARLTPDRPMFYALLLGAINTLVCCIGLLATWNAGPEFGPKWYPISLVILALPSAWMGGIFGRKKV